MKHIALPLLSIAKKRAKRVLKSAFDDLPGIGIIKRKALLQHFGSFEKFKNSSAEEIAEVKGFSTKSALTPFRSNQKHNSSS